MHGHQATMTRVQEVRRREKGGGIERGERGGEKEIKRGKEKGEGRKKPPVPPPPSQQSHFLTET